MELAIKTLEKKIKELEPFKGKVMQYAGKRVLIDEVINQHISAISAIKSVQYTSNMEQLIQEHMEKTQLIKSDDEVKPGRDELEQSKIPSELEKIAEEMKSDNTPIVEKSIEKLTKNL